MTVHNDNLMRKARAMGCRSVRYVPQPIDTALFSPERFDHIMQKEHLGLRGRMIIGYIGTLTTGGIRDIDVILRWIRDTREPGMYHVLVAGGGPQEPELRQLFSQYGITGFTITGLLRHDQMPQYIAAMDVCLVYMRDNPGNRARVSLKVLEALSMLRPVVGVAVGLTQDTFGRYIVPFDKFSDIKKKEYLESLPKARLVIQQEHSLRAVETSVREVLAQYA
jgi:glycosyltransferase involved in cell wall biosynthesis